MTFTYGEDLTDDADFVRFHTGDTESDGAFLSDEIITSLLATHDTKQDAVIAALKFIVTKLSKPDFKAGELEIKYSTSYYKDLLKMKQDEFGLTDNTLTVSTYYTWRPDSDQTEAPTYD